MCYRLNWRGMRSNLLLLTLSLSPLLTKLFVVYFMLQFALRSPQYSYIFLCRCHCQTTFWRLAVSNEARYFYLSTSTHYYLLSYHIMYTPFVFLPGQFYDHDSVYQGPQSCPSTWGSSCALDLSGCLFLHDMAVLFVHTVLPYWFLSMMTTYHVYSLIMS